jgi:hypothetical protein
MESIPEKYTAVMGSAVMAFDCLGNISGSLYFSLISRNWIYYGWFCVGLAVLVLVLDFLLIKESPKYLVTKGKY